MDRDVFFDRSPFGVSSPVPQTYEAEINESSQDAGVEGPSAIRELWVDQPSL